MQDHGGQQGRQWHQDAQDAAPRSERRRYAEADARHRGEERVRERRHQHADEERRHRGRLHARVAEVLVRGEGVAEVEDVLGEREPRRRDARYDDAVDDAVEVPAAEEEQQQYGRGLRRLLHHRRDERRAPRVRVGVLRRVYGVQQPLRGETVGQQRDEGRRARPPREREDQVAPWFRLDPVHPAERRHQQRYGQHGQAEAHQEALRARLLAYECQDHQTGQREQQEQCRSAQRLVVP